MYLTVEDALKIYPLSEGKLTAGQNGVNRIVKSVNVMDAPDIADWVREGDILFTTAYLMKDAPSDGCSCFASWLGWAPQASASNSAGSGRKCPRICWRKPTGLDFR